MKPETAIYVAFDDSTQFDPSEPEKHLMLAILRTAMEDIRKRGEMYRDARRFFLSDDDSYLFSFLSICHQLKLCPRTIRTTVGIFGSAESRANNRSVSTDVSAA